MRGSALSTFVNPRYMCAVALAICAEHEAQDYPDDRSIDEWDGFTVDELAKIEHYPYEDFLLDEDVRGPIHAFLTIYFPDGTIRHPEDGGVNAQGVENDPGNNELGVDDSDAAGGEVSDGLPLPAQQPEESQPVAEAEFPPVIPKTYHDIQSDKVLIDNGRCIYAAEVDWNLVMEVVGECILATQQANAEWLNQQGLNQLGQSTQLSELVKQAVYTIDPVDRRSPDARFWSPKRITVLFTHVQGENGPIVPGPLALPEGANGNGGAQGHMPGQPRGIPYSPEIVTDLVLAFASTDYRAFSLPKMWDYVVYTKSYNCTDAQKLWLLPGTIQVAYERLVKQSMWIGRDNRGPDKEMEEFAARVKSCLESGLTLAKPWTAILQHTIGANKPDMEVRADLIQPVSKSGVPKLLGALYGLAYGIFGSRLLRPLKEGFRSRLNH